MGFFGTQEKVNLCMHYGELCRRRDSVFTGDWLVLDPTYFAFELKGFRQVWSLLEGFLSLQCCQDIIAWACEGNLNPRLGEAFVFTWIFKCDSWGFFWAVCLFRRIESRLNIEQKLGKTPYKNDNHSKKSHEWVGNNKWLRVDIRIHQCQMGDIYFRSMFFVWFTSIIKSGLMSPRPYSTSANQ